MQEFFRGKLQEFYAGSVIGFIAGLKFLFADPGSGIGVVAQYTIKFVAVVIFSFTSGIMTVLAKDIYTYQISPWLKKKFKPNTQDNDKE